MQIENVREAVDARAQDRPQAPFLISAETGTSISCQHLREESIRLSSLLRRAGLQKGDKVAFLMDNGSLSSLLFLGTMYGGYVAVPLNVRAGTAHLSYMVDHCDANIIFVEHQYEGLISEALQGQRRGIRVICLDADAAQAPDFEPGTGDPGLFPVDADDPCLLMYSSGSTGKPKGAIHTHASILAHGRNSIQAHQLTSADRSLLVLPLYHINAECVTLIPTLLSGGSVVVPHRFIVSRFWDWIDDLHVTWAALVPTILLDLVNWEDPGKDGRKHAFERIRFLRSSSAPLAPSLHHQFLDKFNLPLLQAMGSTEAGNVFSNPVPPGKNKIGSPGLPWGFETRIVDREGADVPVGEPGEVLLRGAGLMKGYYKDPEGTAAVVDNLGWLHTGDLARQDEDGYFFVVGRAKELIIKGGVNIAPRAIDEVLESHPDVLEAAAVGVPDPYFGEDAVAFVVLRPESDTDESKLLAYCETRLGHFKTPSRIHFMRELPKGPSGKIQRLRLLDPEVLSTVALTSRPDRAPVVAGGGAANNFCPTDSSVASIIAAAWQEALGVSQVEWDANFFAVGGDSLAAIRCLSELRAKLPLVLSISDFFAAGTVNGQAELVKRRLHLSSPEQDTESNSTHWEQSLLEQSLSTAEEAIPHLESTEPYPLSPAQQRIWFMEQLNPDVPVYNESDAVRLRGDLNVEALRRALNTIVDRHEVLRSTVRIINDVPHSVTHKNFPLRLKQIDLSGLPAGERESEVNRLLIDEPRIHYDLQAEPGIRVSLLRLSARDHVLILMMHHIVCDWSSLGILWRDLSVLYRAFISSETPLLAALPINNRDYAAWHHQRLAKPGIAEDLSFWETNLRGAPELLELPADRVRPAVLSYKGKRLRWKLSRELTAALRNIGRQETISLFTIFSAALNALIYRYTGSDDISLGVPLADRDQYELQSVIGFLLHTHVLRTRLSGDMTFRDLLARVQNGVLDLYVHRAAPFDEIVHRLRPRRNLSYSPLFQVMINWRDREQQLSFIGMEGLEVETLLAESGTSKFDLLLFLTDNGDDIWMELEYSSDLFDQDRCMRMLQHYQAVLEAIVSNPAAKLEEFSLLTASEYKQLIYEWNNTAAEYPKTVALGGLIEAQVERTPNAIAVVSGESRLTFQELNARANQLARELQKHGAGPERVIGLSVQRSADLVIALLGIVKTGAAYLPLDPLFPRERLQYMLEDSGARLLITERSLVADLPAFSGEIILLDDEDWRSNARNNLTVSVEPEHLAYLIYTSGSTGKPKAVQVPRGALTNLLWSMRQWLQLDERDSLLAMTTISFDIAGVDMWLPLLVGASIIVASRESAMDGNALRHLLEHHDITFLQATPVTWQILFEAGWQGKHNLQAVCTGEAMPCDLAARLVPVVERVWNLYGPTETTIWSTGFRVRDGRPPILIGRPVANTQIYILDQRNQPVPIGIVGELWIGGDGLARGYLNGTELTEGKFVADPFRGESARMYRTGDLARYRADGNIECLGRRDHQVKIRGYRIELGEVETLMAAIQGIRESVVIVREDKPGDKRLVAYYTGNNGLSAEQMRSQLSAKLPDYMIPAAFVKLDSLPLTPNGKCDRKALPAPEMSAFVTRAYEAPLGEIETTLADIWSEVLKVERLGRHDNFFDLGGHSLMAMHVISQIDARLGVQVPIRTLFRAQTIAQVAAHIRESSAAREKSARQKWEVVIPIQTQGSMPPLFCVARPNVNALGFVALSRALGNDQPVFGLQSQMEFVPEVDFRDEQYRMAAEEYIRAMKTIQPRGPYHLVGQCQGSYIAFEMVRQLESAGEEVAFLGILDTWTEENTRTKWKFHLDRRARAMLQLWKPASLARTLKSVSGRARSVFITTSPMRRTSDQHRMDDKYWPKADFTPPVCQAPLIVLRVKKQSWFRIADDALGWRNRTRDRVTCVLLPGDHRTFLRQPYVRDLAAAISSFMGSSRPTPEAIAETVELAN